MIPKPRMPEDHGNSSCRKSQHTPKECGIRRHEAISQLTQTRIHARLSFYAILQSASTSIRLTLWSPVFSFKKLLTDSSLLPQFMLAVLV